MTLKVSFDNVNHEWLMKFLRNDIADPNYLRYIARMLKSGVMIEGKYEDTSVGTPQGGLISPILANVYLHYVLIYGLKSASRNSCMEKHTW